MRRFDRGILIIPFALVLMMGAMVCSCDSASAKTKTRIYYTNYDYFGLNMTETFTRYKVVSYYLGNKVKYGKKKEIGAIKNTTNKKVTRSLSVKKSTTRAFSCSVTASLPKKVFQSDVKATIGGSLSFDTSITVSAQGEVPPRSTKSVYLQYKTVDSTYRYVLVKQQKQRNGKWKNVGKSFEKKNVVRTKVPVLIF